jgi:short-subunit dehydrogenase
VLTARRTERLEALAKELAAHIGVNDACHHRRSCKTGILR